MTFGIDEGEPIMKKTIALGVAALGVLTMAGTAAAAHDENPSDRVATYEYSLDAVQPETVPNSQASGSTRIVALPNGKVQVKVEAWGLAPGVHAMHLHGVPGADRDNACPSPAAAGDDGVVTILDGAPFYGGIVASLTTTGDTSPASALALDRFPVADETGYLEYSRTFDDAAAFAEAGTVQVVVHGIDFDGSGGFAFNPDDPFASRGASINPDIPLEATVPVLCGGIAN